MRKGEKQQKQKLSTARWIVILVCAAVFLFSLYNIIDIFQKYSQSKEIYDNAEKTYTVPVEEEDPIPPVIDFDALTEVNKDVIGWIFIEGTDINYPLLKGKTNKQYLFQSYEKKYAVAGSIFLDYRCSEDFSDYNTVVYGHNMKNGTMFGDIDKFADREYLLAHTTAYLSFPAETRRYHIYAWLAVGSLDAEIYQNLNAGTQEERERFLSYVSEKATYINDSLTPSASDKFLVLSTCNNANTAERHILVAFMSYGTN